MCFLIGPITRLKIMKSIYWAFLLENVLMFIVLRICDYANNYHDTILSQLRKTEDM